jgi:hypothetical protein
MSPLARALAERRRLGMIRGAMTKLRPSQKLPPAKKITREVLRENPFLAALIRQRAKQIRELKKDL